jgi:diadenosine tetraphosphate (Ap4A) HIT family hydrolase
MEPPPTACPFCALDRSRVVAENEYGVAIRDAFPVSPGHTLVISRRHVESLFALSPEEQSSVLRLLGETKQRLDEDFRPDGFNIGVNDGPAAGQTVPHLHVHLIPRYRGDCSDPRGGIRWLFPEKANYWSRE